MKLALTFLLVVLSTGVRAETPERLTTLAGKMREGFERARFLCLAEGYPTVTYELYHAALIPTQNQLKAKYPEFWAHGAAQGIAEVDQLWSEKFKRETICEIYRNLGKK